MKLAALATLLLLIAGSTAACQNNPSTLPYKITISTKRPAVNLGEPVYITIAFTNTSDKDINASTAVYGLTGLDLFFRYKVTDESGKPIAKRIYKHPEFAGSKPMLGRIVKAGETLTEEQDISRLFDMEKPGKHIVEVFRNLPEGEIDHGIKSNKLIVTVLPSTSPSPN